MACLLLPSVLLKLESEEKLLGCPLMSCLFSLPLGGGFEYVNCCYLVSGAVRSFFCGISLCFMNILWEAIFARCLPKASILRYISKQILCFFALKCAWKFVLIALVQIGETTKIGHTLFKTLSVLIATGKCFQTIIFHAHCSKTTKKLCFFVLIILS